MFKFAAAFVIGGIFNLLILLLLHALAHSEAGMSAGSVSSSGPSDSVIILVTCGYFFASAFGVFICRTKSALRLWATFAHVLLVIDYVMIFISVKSGDPSGYRWPGEVCKLAMVMATYFSPWLIVWGVVLSRSNLPTDSKSDPITTHLSGN
jgi:hypothetical protein